MTDEPIDYHRGLTYDRAVILPSSDGERLLLLPAGDGWALPHFSQREHRFWQDVGHINRAVRDQMGAVVTTLRCISISYEPADERISTVHAVENHSHGWQPPAGGRWFGRAELAALPLVMSAQRRAIADWLAWSAAPRPPELRAPWYQAGWFARAAAWMEDSLAGLGLPATGPVEQLRSWQRAALLRTASAGGGIYFKAVPPFLAHEPPLTRALATADPRHFPDVLAVDTGRRWMLMRDAGSRTLDTVRDLAVWEEALREFAQVQIAAAAWVDELLSLGCPDRRLARLASQIDPLFADTAAMLTGQPAGLSAGQISRLRALAPRLRQMCRELEGYGLPLSLEHGDFWAGQVVVGDGGFVFIDWSDSSISHPFFSMLFFLAEIDEFFPRLPHVRQRLRDAYLEPWTACAPLERLVAAFDLAQPLAALHYALTYHRYVMPNLEIKWEMDLLPPFYLKTLLRLMEA